MGHDLVLPRGYTEAELEFCFQTLALHGGSAHRAEKAFNEMDPDELREVGVTHTPNKSTLNRWKTRYADRYNEVRNDKVLAKYRAIAAEKHSALADQELEVSELILHRLRNSVDELPVRDLAGALRNTDTGAAINRDKSAQLRGENMGGNVSINFNMNELVRSLTGKGARWTDKDGNPLSPEQAINSTAKEIKTEDL